MRTIVFVSQLDSKTQLKWLTYLKESMPKENILLAKQIDKKDLKHVDIAIVANPDPNILATFPNLVWIQSLWAGVENLLKAGLPKKVKIVRLVDPQLAQTMAEAVVAWTLYLHRNMPEYASQQNQKNWNQLAYTPANKIRVSLLGVGNLGKEALAKLQHFDYQLRCWSRTDKKFDNVKSYHSKKGLRTMLTETDILISLLPLTKETFHLLDATLLSELPKGAKIINFSRGAIIKTEDLVQLLTTRHIAHAVLDVFEQEPLSDESPIWQNPHITVLPHISAPTDMQSSVRIASENILNYRKSNVIPDYVNTELGY